MILICNNFSSIAQLFQLISLAQVEKRRVSGHQRLGNPLGSILTAGQDSDIIQVLNPEMVIADKAYDARSYFKTKDNLNLSISRS